MQQSKLVTLVFCGWLVGCAASLGQSSDCPSGQVTDPATSACVQCVPGTADICPAGEYCTTADTCVAGCTNDSDCSGGKSCCGNQCVDTDIDPENCGTCGATCGQGDACCVGACTNTATLTDCGSCG